MEEGGGQEGRKRFFFEKKNQKTSIHCSTRGSRRGWSRARASRQSFLLLFFKKEALALPVFPAHHHQNPAPCREGADISMQPQRQVHIGQVVFDNTARLSVIAGPCQVESAAHAMECALALREMTARLGIGFVFKSSYDKANRTSLAGARGVGMAAALSIFADIRARLGVPILTDVHERAHCAPVAEVADILQIPAFLCRQTDLIVAAAETGRVVNVKKGQFLAPWDMRHVIAKVTGAGNSQVLVTERGVSFGYNTLVSDMRSLPIMAEFGAPVIFDATHSVQQPGGQGSASGGQREFVAVLARAAVAVGIAGLFIEAHPDPDRAPSAGPNMIALRDFEPRLARLLAFDAIAKRY
jgi:2-dehydro-3-deoxyphosphooctonate aldolase (KDO 8-P synthase)